MLKTVLRGFDNSLCWLRGVFSFDNDPECILRVQAESATHDVTLPGETLRKGERIIHLHLWNEHLPVMPPGGDDLAWAARTWRLFVRSLQRLALQIPRDPRLAGARAVGASSALFTLRGGPSSGARLMEKIGFQVTPYYRPWGGFGEWIENTYSWWLMWAYNPGSMRSRDYQRIERTEIWMSAAELVRRFGGPGPAGAPAAHPLAGASRSKAHAPGGENSGARHFPAADQRADPTP
ncbi:MAG TPA: hypothetical protein VF813_04345 [Anaerolineaceae bacterium]